MVSPRESSVLEFSHYSTEHVELFNELVNRHDHLRESCGIRFDVKARLDSESNLDSISTLNRISEAILWFFAVEFYSRFLSDPSLRNNSKRCLLGLIRAVDKLSNLKLENDYNDFLKDHKELVGYIKTQRLKFFAHADEIEWSEFPNIFPKEYIQLLDNIADILDKAGAAMSLRRVCRREIKPAHILR